MELESKTVHAADVLDTLIDARLLTSYEVPGADDQPPHHRIEIVHESLLSHWPRLVRWQTQDAEGAQLRDELRAQAHIWHQHDRSQDYLWTGTAFKEYELWRERYAWGLTAVEEEYAQAMTAHSERRRRRRRLAVGCVITALLVVLAVVTWSRFQAVSEARRAKAGQLLAIAQQQLDADPTEALAYATASLELNDTEATRLFAMRALWAGPSALVLESQSSIGLVQAQFSPDGRWLSSARYNDSTVLIWNQDGSGPVVLEPPFRWVPDEASPVRDWISDELLLIGTAMASHAQIWSIPSGELIRDIDLGGEAWGIGGENGKLLAEVWGTEPEDGRKPLHLRSWKLPDGKMQDLATIDWNELGGTFSWFTSDANNWFYGKGNKIFLRPLPMRDEAPDRLVGQHDNEAGWVARPDAFGRLWTRDRSTGELRLWDLSASDGNPLRIISPPPDVEPGTGVTVTRDGRWLKDFGLSRDGKALVWDLSSLPGADARQLKRSGSWAQVGLDLHPEGTWAVALGKGETRLTFFPLRAPLPVVVTGLPLVGLQPVDFTPDGQWLATYWGEQKVRLWPLPGSGSREIRELPLAGIGAKTQITIDPTGKRLLVTGWDDNQFVIPLDGGEIQRLDGFSADTLIVIGAFSPSGRKAAAGMLRGDDATLRVWDLETGKARAFDLPPPATEAASEEDSAAPYWPVNTLAFTGESTLYTAGVVGVLRWDLEAGNYERLVAVKPGQEARLWQGRDPQRLITAVVGREGDCGPLILHNLAAGRSRELETFATCPDLPFREDQSLVFDDTLSVMAIGRLDGTLLVGRVGNEEPHLLLGHRGPITDLDISPDGRWIASSGQDRTLRLWPMPDLDKPPLQTLPHDELIEKLRSLTNLQAVRDEGSSTGWSIELGPFPGWEEVPEW